MNLYRDGKVVSLAQYLGEPEQPQRARRLDDTQEIPGLARPRRSWWPMVGWFVAALLQSGLLWACYELGRRAG